MLRKHFDNEIIELSNNLEDVWASIIKKYEMIFDDLTEVQKQSIIDNDLFINEAVVTIDMDVLNSSVYNILFLLI